MPGSRTSAACGLWSSISAEHQATGPERFLVRAGSLGSKVTVDVMPEEVNSPARYAEPGYLLFSLNGTLMAQRFDAKTLKVSGTAMPLVEQVRSTFSASNNNRLVFWQERSSAGSSAATNRLTWFDRKGSQGGSLGEPSNYSSVALSPDERKVAVDIVRGNNRDLYTLDLDRGASERLTSHENPDSIPVWEPAGGKDRIVFSRQLAVSFPPKLFVRPSISSVGEDTLLEDGGLSQGFLPQDWSSEGIVFVARSGGSALSWNLWIDPFPADGKPRAYLETPFRKSHAQVSPNGKWLAFTTNETGTDQIVIQAYPDAKLDRRSVTTNGGTFPRWRKDGRELYYLASDRKLMAVHVKNDVSMSLGETTALFQTELPTGTLAIPVVSGFPYDVASNGQRFLLITPIQSATASDSAPAASSVPFTAILDWTSLLPDK